MAEDKYAIYKRAGMGHRIGYGKRPALLVIDMQLGFTAPEKSPMAGNLDAQIKAITQLVPAARKSRSPIVYTIVAYDPSIPGDGGLWPQKAPSLLELKIGSDLVELDPRLHREAEDLFLTKKYASAFLGTPLASTLVSRGVDTVVVTGCTTSGCVRATVVDALSYGFRPIIPEEAVGDRAQEPHVASLFDMDSKYGDVVPLADVLTYFEQSKS
ncbi:MAG: isochorismatase family protein [Candidatus Binataceae bacterium]